MRPGHKFVIQINMKQILFFLVGLTFQLQAQQWSWINPLSNVHSGFSIDEDSLGNFYFTGHSYLKKSNAQNVVQWQVPLQNCNGVFEGHNSIFAIGYLNNTHTVGSTTMSASSPGGQDGYLACFSTQGVLLWAKQLKSTHVVASSVKIISPNEILFLFSSANECQFNGEIFPKGVSVCRLDFQGNLIQHFSIEHKGSYIQPSHLETDQDQNIYLLAGYSDSVTVGNQHFLGDFYGGAYYMAKFNSQGSVIWLRHLESCNKRNVSSFVVDKFQNIYYVCAESYSNDRLIKLNAAGNEIWQKKSGSYVGGPNAMKLDPNGDILLTGGAWQTAVFENMTINGTYDFLVVAKLDTAGQCLWALKAQASGSSGGNYLSLKTGAIFLGGSTLDGSRTYAGNLSVQSYNYVARIGQAVVASVNSNSSDEIGLFPNPSTGIIQLSSKETKCKYSVSDLSGQTIELGHYSFGKLDLSHLPKGVYILRVNGNKEGRKIILQ